MQVNLVYKHDRLWSKRQYTLNITEYDGPLKWTMIKTCLTRLSFKQGHFFPHSASHTASEGNFTLHMNVSF